MSRRMVALLVVLVFTTMLAAGCGGADKKSDKSDVKPVVLKFQNSTPEGSTWAKGANKFAELVKEKSGGKIEVKVYYSDQLSGGSQVKSVELLSTGGIDFTLHSNITYAVLDERFAVLTLPFLVPSNAIADAKMAGKGGEAFSKLLETKNIVGLAYGENGFRQLFNNVRPVRTPEDIKGLKLRVPTMKMLVDEYQTLGANPTAMNFGEVFTALQQKTIDGQENPVDTTHSAKLHEVLKYMSVWDANYDAIILGMNKKRWDSLDKDSQKILKEAAQEAMKYQIKLNRDLTDERIALFKSKGIEVTVLTDAEKAEFKKALAPFYTKYEPIIGKEMIDAFK